MIFTIKTDKTYYSQRDLIEIINLDTGCSVRDITNIFNSLRNVVKDKFSDADRNVEIKVFPGLSLLSRYDTKTEAKSNLSQFINSDGDFLKLDAKFSKRFKNTIKQMHNSCK